jgi:hypothetical protein
MVGSIDLHINTTKKLYLFLTFTFYNDFKIMEYKKILQWGLFTFFIFNNKFTSGMVEILSRKEAEKQYIAKAQPEKQPWFSFWMKPKKIGVVGASAAAGLGLTTRFLYYQKDQRYDTRVLDDFTKQNKVFKDIDDLSQSHLGAKSPTMDPNNITIIIPHHGMGQTEGSSNNYKKITYTDLLAVYQDIDNNKETPVQVSETSTQIIASFSRLAPKTSTIIKLQEQKIQQIKQYVDKIYKNLKEIKEGNRSKLFYGDMEDQLIKEKKIKEESLKIMENDPSINQESIGNGPPQKSLNSLDEVLNDPNQEDLFKKSQIFQLEEGIKNIESQLQKIQDISKNPNNQQKIGQYIYKSLLDEMAMEKNIFTEDLNLFIFSKHRNKNFLAINSGDENPIKIHWNAFFPDVLDLTEKNNNSLQAWANAIENSIKILEILNNVCAVLTGINQDMGENIRVKKFCDKYLSHKNHYPFMILPEQMYSGFGKAKTK